MYQSLLSNSVWWADFLVCAQTVRYSRELRWRGYAMLRRSTATRLMPAPARVRIGVPPRAFVQARKFDYAQNDTRGQSRTFAQ